MSAEGVILLNYANGAKKAFGECRVGVDPSTLFVSPARTCHADVDDVCVLIGYVGESSLYGTMVRSSGEKDHGDHRVAMRCAGRRGFQLMRSRCRFVTSQALTWTGDHRRWRETSLEVQTTQRPMLFI